MMIQKPKARTFEHNNKSHVSSNNHDTLPSSKRVKRDSFDVVVTNHSDDEAIQLNENGIANMQRGFDSEAENCFTLALNILERKMKGVTLSQKDKNDSASCDNATLVLPSLDVSSSSLNSIDLTSSLSSTDSASVSYKQQRCTYIYQRHEYDEGMDVNTDALVLCADIRNESIRSATLYYNVGQTQIRRGKHEQAKHSFQQALTRLEQQGVVENENERTATLRANLLVQIHHNIGNCLYRLGMNVEALTSYRTALKEAVSYGATFYSATAFAQNAIAVTLFHSDSSCSQQEDTKKECMELFAKIVPVYTNIFGNESKEIATLQNNIGRVYYVQGLYSEALGAYKEALQIRRTILGTESIDLAATICNTGQAYHQLGQYDKALFHYNEFIQLAKEKFGPQCANNHRDVAITLRCIAEVYHEQNQYVEAKVIYENALQVGRNAVGNTHPEVAATLNKLGNLHFERDEYDIALRYYKEGYAIEQQVLEPHHPHRVITLSNIAQIYRQQGQYSTALLTYAEIHKLQINVYGSKSIEVANTLSNMGFMQFHLRSFKSSFDLYQETLRIQRHHYSSVVSGDKNGSNEIAATLSSMGLVSFNMGSLRAALECFNESLRIRRTIVDTNSKDLAILWYNIATIYLEQGDDEEAIKYYKEALRVERKSSLDTNPHDVIMTLQHIGLVHQRRGDLDDALEYFNEALNLHVSKCDKDTIPTARLLNLVGNINLQKGDTIKMMQCYIEASRIYKLFQGQPDAKLVIAGHSFYGFSKLHPPCAPIA